MDELLQTVTANRELAKAALAEHREMLSRLDAVTSRISQQRRTLLQVAESWSDQLTPLMEQWQALMGKVDGAAEGLAEMPEAAKARISETLDTLDSSLNETISSIDGEFESVVEVAQDQAQGVADKIQGAIAKDLPEGVAERVSELQGVLDKGLGAIDRARADLEGPIDTVMETCEHIVGAVEAIRPALELLKALD